MKTVLTLFLAIMALSGCGTMGGAISGAGDDFKKAGDWIKSR